MATTSNPTGYFSQQMTPVDGGVPTIAPTPAPAGIIAGAQGAQSPAPAAPTPAPSAAPVDFTGQLNSLYQKDLNRTGDAAGLDFWKSQLSAGKTDLAGVEQGIMDSDEYKRLHATPAPTAAPMATAAQLGTPTQWQITPDQTVAGQMQKLIDPNNPYYQQWATAGAQDAAARGFTGNSSIRDTAILDSVMRGATPIATADAGTYAKAAGYNADQSNQFAVHNVDAQNQFGLANLSASTQRYVADQSAATQRAVQQMSNQSQAAISAAHDANSLLIQNNQAAANAYSAYVQAVASIDQQPGMDMQAKQTAITTQTQIFNNAIAGLRGANPGTPDVSSPLDIANAGNTSAMTGNPAAAKVGGVDVSGLLSF